MTVENWIAIGLIAATLITAVATALGPTMAVLVQARITKANNQEQKPETENKKFLRKARSVLLYSAPWLTTLVSLWLLAQELRKDEPVNRLTVFAVATYVAIIWTNIILFLVERVLTKVLGLISRIVDAIRMNASSTNMIMEKHVELTGKISNEIAEMSANVSTPSDIKANDSKGVSGKRSSNPKKK